MDKADAMNERVPQVSVVVPARNEAANLPLLVDAISQALQAVHWELLIVDDGSHDDSADFLKDYPAKDFRVRPIFLEHHLGKGGALQAGIGSARAPWIVMLDADLQEPPAEIFRLMEKQREGDFDMVVAWRARRQDSRFKVLASLVLNGLCRGWLNSPVHDLNCGLKLIRSDLARRLSFTDSGFRFIVIEALRLGYSIAEVPVTHRPRRHGKSRFGSKRYLDTALEFVRTMSLARHSK